MKKKIKRIKRMADAGTVTSKTPLEKIGNVANTVGSAASAASGLLGPQNGVSSTLGGLSKVAGSIPGPYGQIASAALSVGSGIASEFTGAKVDMSTGDVTKGGIFGSKSRANRIGSQIKNGLQDSKYAQQNSIDINADWSEDNDGTQTSVLSVANGGSVPVYLDNKETYTTPLGYGGVVPNTGNGTDTHLYQLPEGSRVYSEDLKSVDGKSFSQKAKPYLKALNNKSNDRFAQNTKKLAQQELDNIYNEQESMKQHKGITDNKYKTIQQAASGATIIKPYSQFANDLANTNPTNYNPYNYLMPSSNSLIKSINKKDINSLTNTLGYQYTAPWNRSSNALNDTVNQIKTSTTNGKSSNTKPSYGSNFWSNMNDTLSSVGTMSPIISNLSDRPEAASLYTNPSINAARNIMGGLRYDIQPQLQQNIRNYATANYNANQANTNTGANMAERVANMYNKSTNDATAYSNKLNADNTYRGNYANFLYNSGNDWVNSMREWDTQSAQNRATSRNINRTGLTQLSQYLQTREQMNNQKASDRAIAPALLEYLQGVLPSDKLSNLYKLYYKK